MLFSNEQYLLKISSQEAGRREITDNKITGLAGETPRCEKTETDFDKPSKWLKIMILKEQRNVFLFELGFFLPAVLKCSF